MNPVYTKIYQIATELEAAGSAYTRADLAYELKDYGVKSDSIEVSKLVWEAYVAHNYAPAIQKTFLDNDRKNYIVNQYSLLSYIGDNNVDQIFKTLYNRLKENDQFLYQLSQLTDIQLTPSQQVAINNIKNRIVGTKGVIDVQNQAEGLFKQYSNLVETYDDTKTGITTLIADFTYFRGEILKIYKKYALTLVDIFGDSVEVIDPQLFNFDSIEWLDVHSLFKNIELHYNQLSDRCQGLMSSITTNFSNSLDRSVKNFNLVKSGGKGLGLVMAGLSMLEHYSETENQTIELKKELLFLQNTIKKDSTNIKADYGRLLTITKVLNDVLVPKAQIFYKESDRILATEYNTLTHLIYGNPKVAALNATRDDILNEYQEIENKFIDAQLNISSYTDRINDNKVVLESYRPKYNLAKTCKPSKPFFLFNLLTLGSLKKSYNRSIYEWDATYGKIVREFEELQVDVKIDSEEVKQFEVILKESDLLLKQQKSKLAAINKQIRSNIIVDTPAKAKILKHLKSILQLLALSKDIVSASIDQSLLQVKKIEASYTLALPQKTEENLKKFQLAAQQELNISIEDTKDDIEYYRDNKEHDFNDETIKHMNDTQNRALTKTLEMFEKMAELEVLKREGKMIDQMYDQELSRVQAEFQKTMKNIDNQSAVLRAAITKINLASDSSVVKDALSSLANINYSDRELEDFLNGNRSIKI